MISPLSLSLSEEQTLIRDAARELLARESDSAAVRRCIEGEGGFDAPLWQRLAGELGWCAIGLPEGFGGMGEDLLARALLAEETGARLLCAPWFSTVALAANLLETVASGSVQERWLGAIAAGEISASSSLPSAGDWRQAAAGVQAERDGASWRLHGRAGRIPDGGYVDRLLLLARIEGEAQPGLFAVPADATGLQRRAQPGFDASRCFAEAELTATPAERVDAAGAIAARLEQAAARARLLIAAEQVGGAQRCLELTTAYVAERRQFGRPIASFQAVKHRCAEMMVRIETARSMVYGAAAAAPGNGADAGALAAWQADVLAARLLAGEAFFCCGQEAIQLHGGVGFTWEYDPQLYFKRAQASRHWLGAPEALEAQLASALLGGSEPAIEAAA